VNRPARKAKTTERTSRIDEIARRLEKVKARNVYSPGADRAQDQHYFAQYTADGGNTYLDLIRDVRALARAWRERNPT